MASAPSAACPSANSLPDIHARLSAGASSYDIAIAMGFSPELYHDPVYHAVTGVVGEAVFEMILGGHEGVPVSWSYDEYQDDCDRAEQAAARGALVEAGFDPDDEQIEAWTLEEIQALHEQAWERQDPDSEYNKYASPYARELRSKGTRVPPASSALYARKIPSRARGRCEARPSSQRTRRASSSSRAGPSDSEPGEPPPSDRARLSPGHRPLLEFGVAW